MPQWKAMGPTDRKRLAAITALLKNYPHLIDQLFHPTEPCLRTSPQAICRGLTSGERVLVGLAADLWNESYGVKVTDLLALNDSNFNHVIAALALLRAA